MSNENYTFIDLFSGCGGMRSGVEKAGFKCLFSSEIDKAACKTYEANFGEVPYGDITKIDEKTIPDHDLLVAGFPCQSFSAAGHGLGFADARGTLFFDVARIIKEKRPKTFLLENVKRLKSHNKGKTFAVINRTLLELGYQVKYKVLGSSHLVPQNRERIFIVGFREPTNFEFPEPTGEKKMLKDILEADVDKKYTLSDKMLACLVRHANRHAEKGNGFGYGLADLNGTTRTLLARYYKDGSDILVPQAGNPRKLTPRECARLMGFGDDFKIVCSNAPAYKQFGNSVVVPLIENIARNIATALEGGFPGSFWGV